MSDETINAFQTAIIHGKIKVAVLMGGATEERTVSLQSGKCVTEAMKNNGINVLPVDFTPQNKNILDDETIDVFFIALHGKFGEDGQLQQILEDKSLVYTGSGPLASRLAFDKLESKKIFKKSGINTPETIVFKPDIPTNEITDRLKQFGNKYVIKPVSQGSSVGVSIVEDPKQAITAAQKCFSQFGDCIIEKFIPGREVTVGILSNKPLPIVEIQPKQGFYDYNAKYLDEETQYLFDTITDNSIIGKINNTAISCFNTLYCRHFARIDMILDDKENVYALEVNTIPGFTAHSLLPKAAEKAGLNMADLCISIIEQALKEKNSKKTLLQDSSIKT